MVAVISGIVTMMLGVLISLVRHRWYGTMMVLGYGCVIGGLWQLECYVSVVCMLVLFCLLLRLYIWTKEIKLILEMMYVLTMKLLSGEIDEQTYVVQRKKLYGTLGRYQLYWFNCLYKKDR